MATWDTTKAENETCDNCGAEYEVTIKHFPAREKDSFHCSCGHLMKEWNSTASRSYKLIKK